MNKNIISSDIFNTLYICVLQACESKVTNKLLYTLIWARPSASVLVSMKDIIEDKVQEYGQANRYHDDPNRPDVYA